MKKLSSKLKAFYERNSISIFKKRKKRKHRTYQPRTITGYYQERLGVVRFVPIRAPRIFNLRYENCVAVIQFINELKYLGSRKKAINIIMDDVVDIGEGAIAMLLSVLSELDAMNIIVQGTVPNNKAASDVLDRSGFFKHLKSNVVKVAIDSKNNILTTGGVKTPHSSIVKEVKNAMETIWGVRARCPPLYSGIIEMVRNSCDHAFVNKKAISWHLSLSHFDSKKMVKFSFVDNGYGIFATFSKGFLKTVLSLFKDHPDLINTAFTDGIESRTGLSWRGKGLPTVYEMYTDNLIKNFIVITNNVYIDYANDIRVSLPVSFSGTYYYWEIDPDCEPTYFI